MMANICLWYILSEENSKYIEQQYYEDESNNWAADAEDDWDSATKLKIWLPLFQYAIKNWGTHAVIAEAEGVSQKDLLLTAKWRPYTEPLKLVFLTSPRSLSCTS
jgi:hypothetical protein